MKATGLAIALIVPCSWAGSIPRTYYVSPTGSATYPFSTPETGATVIQDAVEAAQSGEVVQLVPGEYAQSVELKDGVSLWGSGTDSTSLIALDQAAGEAAVNCAGAADIRRIRFVRDPGALSGAPYAIRLSPSGNHVVAYCAFHRMEIDSYRHAVGPALIYECTFEGPGGGVGLGLSAGMVVDSCSFSSIRVAAWGVLVLRRCTFGKAPLEIGAGDILVDSCLFADPGGIDARVSLEGGCSLRMANCILWGYGGELVVNIARNVEIYNCTFVNDSYAIFCDPAEKVLLRNTILWGPPGQLDSVDPASFDVEYCNVAGGWEGEGNIDADPMFADPDNGDFRLRPDSPCIDAGRERWPTWIPGADFTGMARVLYGGRSERRRPDMGAYEYYINRLRLGPLPGQTTLTWSCTFYESYSVLYSDDLVTWHVADDTVGPGYDHVLLSWTDDGSKTGLPPSLVPRRFYRILENR